MQIFLLLRVDDHPSFADTHRFESHSREEQTNLLGCLMMMGEVFSLKVKSNATNQTKNMNFRGEYYSFGALSRYSPECSKLEMLEPMFF